MVKGIRQRAKKPFTFNPKPSILSAGVAKLVDVSDLGSDAARHGGSSPSTRTDESSKCLKGLRCSKG